MAPTRSRRLYPRSAAPSAITAAVAVLFTALPCAAILLGSLATGPARAATIFKCQVNGRTIFQQTACAADPAATPLEVRPGNTVEGYRPPPVSNAPPAAADAAPTAAPPAASGADPAAPAPRSALEQDADMCLEHLRPMLRDPRSAYVSEPSRRARVLSLTLHASNPRGGIVTRPAACEIFNGRVDARWTRIHLERLGWFKLRPALQGPGARFEAMRLELDDIEAPPKR